MRSTVTTLSAFILLCIAFGMCGRYYSLFSFSFAVCSHEVFWSLTKQLASHNICCLYPFLRGELWCQCRVTGGLPPWTKSELSVCPWRVIAAGAKARDRQRYKKDVTAKLCDAHPGLFFTTGFLLLAAGLGCPSLLWTSAFAVCHMLIGPPGPLFFPAVWRSFALCVIFSLRLSPKTDLEDDGDCLPFFIIWAKIVTQISP